MKCCFLHAGALMDAIALVADELDLTVAAEADAALVVDVTETDADVVSVTLDGCHACITYGGGTPRFLRGLAALNAWVKAGKTSGSLSETPLFLTNGAMIDMSRNAVMTVDSVKKLCRISTAFFHLPRLRFFWLFLLFGGEFVLRGRI